MRLADLDPRFYAFEVGGQRVGLTFECPHCRQTRLGVAFHRSGHEAIEDDYIRAHAPATKHIWTMDGASFDDMTLSPSVDASQSGHWHGFIQSGTIVGGV